MKRNELLAEIKRKELTQEKVADFIGITRGTLSRKLKGETEFTASEIGGIMNLLELPEDRVRAIFFDVKVE